MEIQRFARNVALVLGFCSAAIIGQEKLTLRGPGDDFGAATSPVVWNAPENTAFYDHPLIESQYGFGTLGSVVAGAMGFYLGNAVAGAFYHSDAHEGYLSFTGIRYHDWSGPFYGGASGVLLGSVLTTFFVGEQDEEPGSIFWTSVGGIATTAAAFYLAKVSGVQDQRSLLPFVPLLILPSTGSVVGYNVSRWFNAKERRKVTESGTAFLHPPKLEIAPRTDGLALRLDAINLSF